MTSAGRGAIGCRRRSLVMKYASARKPACYFIGVTTAQSSIVKVFRKCADFLGLGDVAVRGVDLAPHDAGENYRAVVEFLKDGSLGGL